VDKTVTIEAKTGDVLVVDKVLSLSVEDVVFIPISPDSEDSA
jgi:hypothetical protein